VEIHTLDLNFQGVAKTIASYLVKGPLGYILIESGPGSTLKTLISRLGERGLQLADIDALFVTHIHLDHAGAAGSLARQGIPLYVHHVGAPHLIDPSKLLASAERIYGDRMGPLWGDTHPAPENKVTALRDRDVVNVAGLAVTALDTPGHAYHHHVYVIDKVAFTGDAAGILIEGTSFVNLPAPPPEFNLELWQNTLNQLVMWDFEMLYPTHFGRVSSPIHQLEALRSLLREISTAVNSRLRAGDTRQAILNHMLEWQQERAAAADMSADEIERDELVNPTYMSVDGVIRYWTKKGI
jgi:glyoxylase-like metal-dependent hydrolase (beta-lactamase superfamily II)